LDLPLIELQYKESEFKIISLIYPLLKPIKLKPIISKYYFIASYDLQRQVNCFITPTLKKLSTNPPKSFNVTNNLRRKTSSPFVAAGDIIYIKGKITDINCTPIANAVINIWQADSYGRYDSKLEKYFLGNGTAISDNMGNFEFITILPANTSQTSAPHINLSATHDNFDIINTKMFFGNNILNVTDETRKNLDWFNKSLITAEILPVNEKNLANGFYMLFNLTFNGISPYKNAF
jgi:protocatechuate 3,4-dioxygenase beta subunit